jgi:lipopolysaccharide/colanic/teichoic acid biosynthesis glycosyltransferase
LVRTNADVTALKPAVEKEQQVPFLVRPVSPWTRSIGKRLLDVACVLCGLPVVLPAFVIIGIAVRLTSRGPVLFLQQRMGRNGRAFFIVKFRTMPVCQDAVNRPAVTSSGNQIFTPVGPFLRRWKLDELPQLFNVLRGDMSLVGPRPKIPEHQTSLLHCRPGITGAATIAFAHEEAAFASIPHTELDTYYHAVILPFKQQLDEDYMSSATFVSDLDLVVRTVTRDWDEKIVKELARANRPKAQHAKPAPKLVMRQATNEPRADSVTS